MVLVPGLCHSFETAAKFAAVLLVLPPTTGNKFIKKISKKY